MAKMIPTVLSPDTESKAEGKVYFALCNSLDDSYTVFHSFGIFAREPKFGYVDREIDFLIFSEKKGLLALEVKGGHLAYDGNRGVWLQNDRVMKKSPYKQALLNKYAIQDYLKERLQKDKLKLSVGHAVCFPDVNKKTKNMPAEAIPEITITGEGMNDFGQNIESAMNVYLDDNHRYPSRQEIGDIEKALMPEFEYGTPLVDSFTAAERRLFRLTEEQCTFLHVLGNRKRALVRGCAGSGKTCLAVRKAKELAACGMEILLLCYNKPLGQQLIDSIGDDHGNITVTHYHSFCMNRLREAGVEVEVRSEDPDFWRDELPEIFDSWMKDHPLQYDAIIVDEGQDFTLSYWVTVEGMLKSDGYLYIFYDPDQNLYGTDLEFPEMGEPFILERNCRNTRQISAALKELSGVDMRLHEMAPEGEPVKEIRCSSDRDLRKALGKALHELINVSGLSTDQVVVLGGHSIKNTCLGENSKIGNFTVKRGSKHEPNTIRYSTYMRFKGCEADAVILLGVDENDDRWSDPMALYTAMSRAKFLLYVLYKE